MSSKQKPDIDPSLLAFLESTSSADEVVADRFRVSSQGSWRFSPPNVGVLEKVAGVREREVLRVMINGVRGPVEIHPDVVAAVGRIDVSAKDDDGRDVAVVFEAKSQTARRASFVGRSPAIERAPGSALLGLIGWFVQPRTKTRVFGQVAADMYEECIEARAAKKPSSYWAAWFRGHLAIVGHVFAWMGVSVIKRVVEIWKAV